MNNRYIKTKTLLIKYFPIVSWTCIEEKDKEGENTGNLFCKGFCNKFTFEFYGGKDWESLVIWFSNHHLLVESIKRNTYSTNELLTESFSSLRDLIRSISILIKEE